MKQSLAVAITVKGLAPVAGTYLATPSGTLADFAGGRDIAGARLRSTEWWPDQRNDYIPGTDMYGFSALPAGDSHSKPGYSTSFWGTTGYLPDPTTEGILNTGYASVKILDYNFAKIGIGYDRKDATYSVHCVKN